MFYNDFIIKYLQKKEGRMKKAFTLAEVLITLTIIGVIAALTIPNLMQNWQKEVTITKVKKAYNILNRAATNIKINTNCDDLACTGLYNITTSWTDTKEFLLKFTELAQIKDYKLHETNGTFAGNLGCKAYAGCSTNPNVYFSKHITTQDGLLLHLIPVATYESVSADKKSILVAVGTEKRKINGTTLDQSTFVLGKNMFLFTIYGNFKVEPVGWYGTSSTLTPLSQTTKANISKLCNSNSTDTISNGTSCAAKILLDGWKINY